MLSHIVRFDRIMGELLDCRRSSKVQKRVEECVHAGRCLQCEATANGAGCLCIRHETRTRRRLDEIASPQKRLAAKQELIRRGLLLAPYEIGRIRRAGDPVAKAIEAVAGGVS